MAREDSEIVAFRRLADRTREEYAHANRTVREEAAALVDLRTKAEDAAGAQQILQGIAQTVQQSAHEQIAKVVTRALETVFDEPMAFRIDFEKKRGKTEAKLVFTRDGNEEDPLMGSGGVLEVAAFALRVAALILQRPPLRKIIFADEPFKSVHGSGNRRRLVGLIDTLSRDFDIQIILVTGLDWLRVGKIIEVEELS